MPHYKESSGLCPTCQERRLVRRKSISGPVHAIHITLSFLTLGMWLIVYVINFAARQDTWRCAVCGTPVEPDPVLPPGAYEAQQRGQQEQQLPPG